MFFFLSFSSLRSVKFLHKVSSFRFHGDDVVDVVRFTTQRYVFDDFVCRFVACGLFTIIRRCSSTFVLCVMVLFVLPPSPRDVVGVDARSFFSRESRNTFENRNETLSLSLSLSVCLSVCVSLRVCVCVCVCVYLSLESIIATVFFPREGG